MEVFFTGALEIANFFISIFIIYYAFQFLRKSHSHHHRRPWEYMAFAVLMFAIFELLGILEILKGYAIPGLRELFLSIFAAIILLSFNHQHHLIHRSDEGIHIHKKAKHKKSSGHKKK